MEAEARRRKQLSMQVPSDAFGLPSTLLCLLSALGFGTSARIFAPGSDPGENSRAREDARQGLQRAGTRFSSPGV